MGNVHKKKQNAKLYVNINVKIVICLMCIGKDWKEMH